MKIEAKYIGKRTDPEGKWEHMLWHVTLEHEGRTLETPWKAGMAHVVKRKASPFINPRTSEGEWRDREGLTRPKPPDMFDVLYSLCMDAQSYENARDFEDFCGEFGYSTDSIKADQTYRACGESAKRLRSVLGRTLFDQLCGMDEDALRAYLDERPTAQEASKS